MTDKEVYDALVSLTSEIQITEIGLDLFDAAKSGKKRNVEKICEAFSREYPDLYKKMNDFSISLNNHMMQSFSNDKEESLIYMYDSSIIHAPSFFALTFLTEINDLSMYSGVVIQLSNRCCIIGDEAYLNAIEEESGSSHLADFLGIATFSKSELAYLKNLGYDSSSVYQLLVDAYSGSIKEFYRQ